MMLIEPWILWTLLAACMQSVRTATQKQLTAHVSAEGATLVRYLYGIPFILVYLGILLSQSQSADPYFNLTFVLCVIGAGVLQVVATVLLIRLFTLRNFAVGSTYARSEIVMTAVLGIVLFADMVSLVGGLGILVCSVGLGSSRSSRIIHRFSKWSRTTSATQPSTCCNASRFPG